jgi:hypothetical protein
MNCFDTYTEPFSSDLGWTRCGTRKLRDVMASQQARDAALEQLEQAMNRIDTPIRELSDEELDARLAAHFSAPARYSAHCRVESGQIGPVTRVQEGAGYSVPGVSMIPSLAHDEASWLRASRSVGPVVTPCKPLPLLTRWGMRLSQWFNRKV